MLRDPNADLDPDSVGGHAGTKLLMYEHSRTSTLAGNCLKEWRQSGYVRRMFFGPPVGIEPGSGRLGTQCLLTN